MNAATKPWGDSLSKARRSGVKLFPASAIVPTRDRPAPMATLLASLSEQDLQPAELIVVDASLNDQTMDILKAWQGRLSTSIRYLRAGMVGAAVQRNEGIGEARKPYILFMDDDIRFEPDCLQRLWSAMQADSELGGVSAMIVNQCYARPGAISRAMFRLLNGKEEQSYAGKVLGPALNLLPEDDNALPDVVDCEWLNTTCTLYRREALPSPPFCGHFTGYSMMEDLTLSLIVGRDWRLANARTARIYHDSVQSDEKRDVRAMARMEFINRHYVMRYVLGRRTAVDYMRLAVLNVFSVVSATRSAAGIRSLPKILVGKFSGLSAVLTEVVREQRRR